MVYLVTGASGNQGEHVARALLEQGAKVRLFVRDPKKVEELKKLGCEVAVGDLKNAESIRDALQGCDGAFLNTVDWEAGPDGEIEQGMNFLKVAKELGLPHLVYSSVALCDQTPQLPFFDCKWQVEQEIHNSGLSWTILRPAFFMENFNIEWYSQPIVEGHLVMPLTERASLSMVSFADVGRAAAICLLHPEKYNGETMTLGGHELSVTEMARVIGEVSGREISFMQLPPEVAEKEMSPGLPEMYRLIEELGRSPDSELENKLGFKLMTWEEYLVNAPWMEAVAKAH